MKADRNENTCCDSRNCRNKSCFALLTIRKEVTHRIPVNAFRLQADRPWKIAVVSVQIYEAADHRHALPDLPAADGQRSAEEKAGMDSSKSIEKETTDRSSGIRMPRL